MAFDFATFLSTIPAILDARLPVLIRGRHGVGKSEVANHSPSSSSSETRSPVLRSIVVYKVPLLDRPFRYQLGRLLQRGG